MADTKTFEKQINIKAQNSFQAQAILAGLENAQNVLNPDELLRVLNRLNNLSIGEKQVFLLKI